MPLFCSFCSAPLGPTTFGQAQCPKCGSVNRFDVPQTVTDQRLYRENVGSAHSWWVRGIGFVLSVTFCGLLVKYLLGFVPKVYEEPPPPAYHAADLHDLSDRLMEIGPIDPSGLGSLAAFDPIAHLPWFENLARTWSPDARLVTLELHGVRALGTLDIATPASDPYVRYEFASKARGALAKQMAKTSAAASFSAIDIVLKRNLMRALLVNSASEDRDPAPLQFGCGIPQLIDMWRSKGLAPKATYNLELDDSRGPKPDFLWHSIDLEVSCIGLDCRFR
jgi:hypothetical protein